VTRRTIRVPPLWMSQRSKCAIAAGIHHISAENDRPCIIARPTGHHRMARLRRGECAPGSHRVLVSVVRENTPDGRTFARMVWQLERAVLARQPWPVSRFRQRDGRSDAASCVVSQKNGAECPRRQEYPAVSEIWRGVEPRYRAADAGAGQRISSASTDRLGDTGRDSASLHVMAALVSLTMMRGRLPMRGHASGRSRHSPHVMALQCTTPAAANEPCSASTAIFNGSARDLL